MANTHNFRSALNGFNRQDVVCYIEYLNTKNTNLVNQLKSENQSLKDELAALRSAQPQEVPAEPQEDLRPQLEAAQARIAELEAQLAETNTSLSEQELEAYRRAERMERNAKARADEIYRKAAATLAEASTQLDGAVAHYTRIADSVADQIGQLRTAAQSSKEALENAAATMYAIRPEGTEE